MRLHTRLDTLARWFPPAHIISDADTPIRKLCEGFERQSPIPAGETYPGAYARLDAVLDRLSAVGVGVAAGPLLSRAERIAAAWGISVREFRDAVRERAGR